MDADWVLERLRSLHRDVSTTLIDGTGLIDDTDGRRAALEETLVRERESAEQRERALLQRAESAEDRASEALERAEAAEAEVLERMRLVADCVGAEDEARSSAQRLEGELFEVRTSAAGRLKQLIASSRTLEEELLEKREQMEVAEQKMSALQEAVDLLQREGRDASARAAREARSQAQQHEYVRTLVIRYMELESEHAALFPALATCFKLTREEVARIQSAQHAHAQRTSLFGRAWSAGTSIVEAATQAARSTE